MRMVLVGIMYALQLCMYAVGSNALFSVKMKRKWLPILLGGVFVVVLAGCAESKNAYEWYFQMAYYIPLMTNLCLISGNAKERFVYIFSIFCISLCTAEVFGVFVDYGLTVKSYFHQISNIIETILNIGLFILLGIIKKKVADNLEKLKQIFRKIVVVCVLFMGIAQAITICGLLYAREYLPTEQVKRAFEVVSMVSLLGVAGTILFIMYIRIANQKMEQLLLTERKLKQMQEQYYTVLLEKEEETRKYRHDMKNHLLCLYDLSEKEKVFEIKEYIGALQNEFLTIQRKSYCTGNDIIDVLLNYHLSDLEDIKISVIGKCSDNLPVSDMDFCTIFSNLIKNAVEEVKKQKEENRYIKVHIRQGKQNLSITIINSSQKVLDKEMVKTSKKDKRNHGIGLKNVKAVIEKNGGIFKLYGDGKEVTAEVIL
ncbi:MAG: GHKL domain-containing protein [Lachnospiraceae bacterium]|nr:GHKL domain-containing protein [Lachnospiraceae bacterium]